MPKKIIIVPALLAEDKKNFKRQYQKVKNYFDYFQIDIMDGILVKDKSTITPEFIKKLVKGKKIELHLMVKDVSKYISKWQKLKNVKKIIWHYEAEKNNEAIICLAQYLKKNKIKAGLAINANTPLYKIKKIIKYFDTIQTMGIQAGAQGKKFQPKVIKKIKAIRSKYPKLNISVDGGVNEKNIKAIKYAGANIIAVGSYFQNCDNVKQSLDQLKN